MKRFQGRFPLPAALLFLLPVLYPARGLAASAVVEVDAGVTLNSFQPSLVFGLNTFPYVEPSDLLNVQSKLQAAHTAFFRYPDGYAEYYHWNGKGSFNSKGWWVPDDTSYAPGFRGFLAHRGTSSNYGNPSLVTDGNPLTAWLSNADTDAPHAQWIYLDLGSLVTADSVSILWGKPYATRFRVQHWNPSASRQWAPLWSDTNEWLDTSAARVAGKGGAQYVRFKPVSSRFFRLLLTESSAKPTQYSIAEIYLFNGSTQLTKNTATVGSNNNPDQTLTMSSSQDPACTKESIPPLDFESFMAFVRSFHPAVSPILTVNFAGTPQEAAAWVHYANKVKGYGVKYWEMGNEMNGWWDVGSPVDARDYARRYIKFYEAMKAEDPTILIAGPGPGDAYAVSDNQDGKTFIQGFIDRLASDPGGNKATYAEILDFHWYPFFQNDVDSNTWATVSQWAKLASDLPLWLKNHPKGSEVPILNSEFCSGAGTPFSSKIDNGLWLANTFGEFIRYFGSRGMALYWCAITPSDAATNVKGGDQGFFQQDKNAYQYQERSVYWAVKMMTNDWAPPGDGKSHALVKASIDQPGLSAYADYRPDGVLSLLVVNKGETCPAEIRLAGFNPNPSPLRTTLDSSNYAWETTAPPYHASPDKPPSTAVQGGVSPSFHYTFPAKSLTVFQFTDATRPTNTPTPTPTITLTPSPTPTPHWGPVTLIDDFEDPTKDGMPPARMNLWGGTWALYVEPHCAVTVSYGPPGAGGTGRSAHLWGTISTDGWSSFTCNLSALWPPTPLDAKVAELEGLQFWILGDGRPYRAMIQTSGITDYDYYGTTVTPPAGVWTFYRLPFRDMRRSGWGKQNPAPPVLPSAEDVTGVQFSTQKWEPFDVRIDQVGFYSSEALTPQPTP
jgi:hypothetical protein